MPKYANSLVTLFVAAAANSFATWFGPSDGTFSPDGTKIAYVSAATGDPHIYTVNADGSARKNLTPAWDYISGPAVFTRGAKIAFTGVKVWSENILALYTVNADGSNLKLFTDTDSVNVNDLVVSPTGDRFLIRAYYYDDANASYVVVNADGLGLTQLTKKPYPPRVVGG